MQAVIKEFEAKYRKPALPQVRSGDTVRVQQRIVESGKQRVQSFTGTVIRTSRMGELTAAIAVRWIASGVGVEKTIPLHAPSVVKIEIIRRGRVRRNFLSYLRERRGKSARLSDLAFDREAVNVKDEPKEQAAAADAGEDAEVTEIEQDTSVAADEPVEEEVKEESKEAAQADPEADPDAATDEQNAPKEEAEAGVAKAEPKE